MSPLLCKALQFFKRRSDNQIMGLELLAISLGLATFVDTLRGRKVIVHSDNTGSEVSGVCILLCMGCVWHAVVDCISSGHCTVVGPRAAGAWSMAACSKTSNVFVCHESGNR